MIEQDTNLSENHYSRRQRAGGRRRRRTSEDSFNSSFSESLPKIPLLPSFFWSLFISFFSVANPLMTSFADNAQYQNLYAGWAMTNGQSPYNDFFATNGLLYYLMVFVTYLIKLPFVLVLFQFIALFIAGIYLNKIVVYFSKQRGLATHLTVWFYLFVLCSGFGGIYASLFALPFILTSIWFLIRYFENAVRDESFILYGIDAALVFMIYPKGLLLWIVAGLILFVYNSNHNRLARGFYQLLATLFGFLLVVYTVGYYAFEQQILGTAIQQTFLHNSSLHFQYDHIWQTLLIVSGSLLVSGFLHFFVATIFSLQKMKHFYIKLLMLLAFLAQLLFIVGNKSFEVSQLLIVIPYGFTMAAFSLSQEASDAAIEEDEERELDFSYLRRSFYLPLLICLAIPLRPFFYYMKEDRLHQERMAISRYLEEHSKKTDKITVWDSTAQIYVESKRLSATTILTPTPSLDSKDNRSGFVFDFNKNEPTYVVVNPELSLLDDVQSSLERQYTLVDAGTKQLKIYQRNN